MNDWKRISCCMYGHWCFTCTSQLPQTGQQKVALRQGPAARMLQGKLTQQEKVETKRLTILTISSQISKLSSWPDPEKPEREADTAAHNSQYAALAKTACRFTVFTRPAVESVHMHATPRLRIPGVPRTIARHLLKELQQYDETTD